MRINTNINQPNDSALILLYKLIKQKRESYNGTSEEVSVFLTTPYYSNKILLEQNEYIYQETVEGFTALKCLFLCQLDFEGSDIIQQVRITDSFFEKDFKHYAGTFEDDVKFTRTIFNGNASFSGVRFEGTADFYDAKFGKGVKFIGCTFKNYVSFENTVFGGTVEFTRCTFEDAIDFRLSESYRDKAKTPYYHPMKCRFKDCTFKKKAIFYHRHFPECSFENTKFEGLVDFYNTRFDTETRFYKTDFLETAVFSKAVFSGAVVFHYAKVAKNMILRETSFNGGVNMAYINFISNGFLELFGLNIDSRGFLSVSEPPNYDIDQNDDWKTITHHQKRETYRILKHEALKQNNRIQALEYHAQEMKCHTLIAKELQSTIIACSDPYKLRVPLANILDRQIQIEEVSNCDISRLMLVAIYSLLFIFVGPLILILYIVCTIKLNQDLLLTRVNQITNEHGQNWKRGIGVTLLTALVFFVFYLFSLNQYSMRNLGELFSNYSQFLNPAHSYSFMSSDDVNLGSWSILIDSMSRILIGVGIYQTIQAFRKYGRF